MKKKYIEKLINLGFLESKDLCSIYGQEVLDKFLNLLISKLIKNDFKHYKRDFINEEIRGKFYRIDSHYLEIVSRENNINNEALDLAYLLSKFLKDTLGIAIIEGYRLKGKYKTYYGYIYLKGLEKVFEIKQNQNKTYLRFDLFNIFYSIIEDNSYLSYLITPEIAIIPLHQNKSGVLSYASKVQERISINSYIDDSNLSPAEKTKLANNKRLPLKLFLGPKEYKHQKVIVEYNHLKEEILFDDLNCLDDYLINTLKNKYNSNLRQIFLFEKQKSNLDDLSNLSKVNICEECNIKGYQKFLIPFNRVSKTSKCLVCQKENNNIIYIKRAWY